MPATHFNRLRIETGYTSNHEISFKFRRWNIFIVKAVSEFCQVQSSTIQFHTGKSSQEPMSICFRLPYRNSRSSKKREDPETGVTAPNTDGLQQDSSLSGDLASLAASSRGDAVTIGSMPLDGSGTSMLSIFQYNCHQQPNDVCIVISTVMLCCSKVVNICHVTKFFEVATRHSWHGIMITYSDPVS